MLTPENNLEHCRRPREGALPRCAGWFLPLVTRKTSRSRSNTIRMQRPFPSLTVASNCSRLTSSITLGPSRSLERRNLIGQFSVGCMMRAVTAFLSLPLACCDDVRLGNPAVDVDVVIDGAGCAGMATADHLLRKYEDSPTVRTNRVLDLAEQEGLQTACIPGACDGNMSNYFKIREHPQGKVVVYADVPKDNEQAMMSAVAQQSVSIAIETDQSSILPSHQWCGIPAVV